MKTAVVLAESPEYRPSEDEEFMNERQLEYFKQKLLMWKEDILRESRETLSHLQKETENHPEIRITHLHLNDQTVAGIRMKDKKCFSVQYHPEASPGPNDAHYLFDEFIHHLIAEHA